ncbi:MAG TPA: FG-GAP repeat protein, partial [Dyadobacter sp.]|nr:FG-GAP repeat protein [Dyadobacter sp.]
MKNFFTFLKATAILLALSHCIYAQNWDQIIKAVSSDRELRSTASRSHYDYFGGSVSVSGSYAVVGAQHEAEDNTGGNTVMYSGAAYV